MVQRLRPWLPELLFAAVILLLGVALWFTEDLGGAAEFVVRGLLIGAFVSWFRRFRSHRAMVGPETGLTPGPRLTSLWVKPGRGSPLDAAACPVPFSGRDREMAMLDAWLDDRDAPPVMVVAGAPGVGKSRLMVEFARRRSPGRRAGRLRPGSGKGLVALLTADRRPALVVVQEGDLRDDMDALLTELPDGNRQVRLLVEVRHPGGLAPHSGAVLWLEDPDDLDRIFHDALKAFWREPGEVGRPEGRVFEVVAAALEVDPLADWRAEAPAVVASMLLGPRPAPLRRVPELAALGAEELKWLAEWTSGHPVRPVALAGRLLGEVAAARPGLIDRLTEHLSIPQARRALWWLALIADESPEAAEACLRLAVHHETLLFRAVCCLAGDGLAERVAELVAARRWTAAELAAMDSPGLPGAVRAVLAAKSKGLTGPAVGLGHI
ncbi:AAA family ATPase [Herbidospora cretacea]|uniref:AAA family ATPase n=1 Tax=Herbidospora cretacea TaxID=28444 RepID=UPI000774A14A|nr:AAA family ATPase [Herbidospora cretacea]